VNVLRSEFELEVERIEKLVVLVDSLEGLIGAKELDIANEKKITNEMIDVRAKLKDGPIAVELDELIEQKLNTAAIEQELMNALNECLVGLQNLLEDASDRAARTKQIMDGLAQVRPETRSSEPYDWTDFEALEQTLQNAADNVDDTEKRIRELSERIDDALVDRAVVLGEDVPPGLEKAAQRAAIRSIKKLLSSPDVDLDFEGFLELKNKDAKELFAILTKSVGGGTDDGSKAGGTFNLKSLLDAMTGKSS